MNKMTDDPWIDEIAQVERQDVMCFCDALWDRTEALQYDYREQDCLSKLFPIHE